MPNIKRYFFLRRIGCPPAWAWRIASKEAKHMGTCASSVIEIVIK
jgi:hypothetical protein